MKGFIRGIYYSPGVNQRRGLGGAVHFPVKPRHLEMLILLNVFHGLEFLTQRGRHGVAQKKGVRS